MFTAKITRKGQKLRNIRESVRKLDKSKVEIGYFATQGKHKGLDGISDYTYAGLAQALELGLTLSPINFGVPMKFMDNIGILTSQKMYSSSIVKKAFREWGRQLEDDVQPTKLLDAIGRYGKLQSKQVFNNPAYFLSNPENKTPLYETGELAEHFAYRNSVTKTVRL